MIDKTIHSHSAILNHTPEGREMVTSHTAARASSISTHGSQMGEHTPGPWEASGEGVWAKSPWNARVRIASVTQFASMNGIDTAANARLIAAAPELLAELIALLNWAQAFGAFRDDVGEGAERHVRDLIAKATGA